MLMARNADICSKCLVTEPWVRSFIGANLRVEQRLCQPQKNFAVGADAATTIILNRHFLLGSLPSEAGDGTLLQSISVLSIFAPLWSSHALIWSPIFSP
jgi:hypothetical protein